eukprot:scaffold48472_cov42-Cyclotella_meneghiniana.AAC.4
MMSNQCASCGKADGNLKACKACKLVKYCGVECQVAHRPAHKKACKKRAVELFDEKLFAKPPAREECPICMITLSCDDRKCVYMSCCGKLICNGCRYCLTRDCCPFCNRADPTRPEFIKRASERIEKYNDPEAMVLLGCHYIDGLYGLRVDQPKAFELFQQASQLGSAAGHYNLAISYDDGVGVERDTNKAFHHYQIAAIMGNVHARNNLGYAELENRNYQRAMKHFMIASKCGSKISLNNVKQGYKQGQVTKEGFEKTLRDYQAACDETKSEQRDRAASIIQAGQRTK